MTEPMTTSTQARSSRGRIALRVALCVAVALAAGASGYGLGERSGYAAGFDSGYQQGGESGFENGFVTGQMSASAVEGALAAHVSKLIRRGDTSEAISFLEETVDTSLVLYSGFVERERSPFDQTDLATGARRVMEKVAEHRSAQPPVSEDPGVRETIASVLASLQPTTK